MSHMIVFQGIREGVGNSSVIAMLGDALNQQGGKVLLVDLTPSNALRLMFNIAYADQRGWAHSLQAKGDWREAAFEVTQNLFLLPHGRASSNVQQIDAFCAELIKELQNTFDWILFDLPPGPTTAQLPNLHQRVTLKVTVLAPDVGCHLRWIERPTDPRTHFLVTQFDPSRKLASELVSEWQYQTGNSMWPVMISADESVHEAFATKSTATRMFPASSATANMHSLATWLLAQGFKGRPA